MIVLAKPYTQGSSLAEIVSAIVGNMKIIRYIRPTARWTKAKQELATNREDIRFTIVEGELDSTFADALKLLKPGNGLLVENLMVFA